MSKRGSSFISKAFSSHTVHDSSFAEVFMSLPHLGQFYGTSTNDKRSGYQETIKTALTDRIAKPITKWCKNPKSCFFKPYYLTEAVNPRIFAQSETPTVTVLTNAFSFSVLNPLFATLTSFGILGGALSTNIVLAFTIACFPAINELIVGTVGVCLAAWHQSLAIYQKIQGNSYFEQKHHDMAAEYFLDAVTRFALAIPLAIVMLAATPLDFVRFCTRGVSTLITLLPTSTISPIAVVEDDNNSDPVESYSPNVSG